MRVCVCMRLCKHMCVCVLVRVCLCVCVCEVHVAKLMSAIGNPWQCDPVIIQSDHATGDPPGQLHEEDLRESRTLGPYTLGAGDHTHTHTHTQRQCLERGSDLLGLAVRGAV